MNLNKTLPEFKVVFVGDAAVGKTSIIMRYHNNVFPDSHLTTIGSAFISKTVSTQFGDANLHIWDTAGQERYRSLIPMYARGAAAAIVVFDVSNPGRSSDLEEWISRVKRDVAPDCKIFVAGNKLDLERAAGLDEVMDWAKANDFQCILVSAKTGDNVEKLFDMVAASFPEHKFKSSPPLTLKKAPVEDESACC